VRGVRRGQEEEEKAWACASVITCICDQVLIEAGVSMMVRRCPGRNQGLNRLSPKLSPARSACISSLFANTG
jgi:hypothetical protein